MKSTKHRIDPVVVTFSPSWFYKNYGVDYSEQTWQNPIDRLERNRELERVLYERFGDVGIGSADPEPTPSFSDTYGNYFMPALFGCEIHYLKDQAPGNLPLDATLEDMRNIAVPDFDESPVIRRALEEARILKERCGFCSGVINTGSPLNVAVNIFGEQFLLACALEPEIALHVLRVIAETEFKLYREVSAVIQPECFPRDNIVFSYGNCPAVMFSPNLYREVVLPVDKWVRSQAAVFNLHHCGVFDHYIELYQELCPSSLDIGGGSNYRAIRGAFPDVPVSLIMNAPDVEGRSNSEVDNLIGNMVDGAAPESLISCLWIGEAGDLLDDGTVRAVRTAHERI